MVSDRQRHPPGSWLACRVARNTDGVLPRNAGLQENAVSSMILRSGRDPLSKASPILPLSLASPRRTRGTGDKVQKFFDAAPKRALAPSSPPSARRCASPPSPVAWSNNPARASHFRQFSNANIKCDHLTQSADSIVLTLFTCAPMLGYSASAS
jgi:hypothetical protein